MSVTDTPPVKAEKRSVLDTLPPELSQHRIFSTRQTCEFVGVSPAEWRRLRARGEAPPPVLIGIRKHGWKVGVLIDWIERRSQRRPLVAEEA